MPDRDSSIGLRNFAACIDNSICPSKAWMLVCSNANRRPPIRHVRSTGALCPSSSGDRNSPPFVPLCVSRKRTTAWHALPWWYGFAIFEPDVAPSPRQRIGADLEVHHLWRVFPFRPLGGGGSA